MSAVFLMSFEANGEAAPGFMAACWTGRTGVKCGFLFPSSHLWPPLLVSRIVQFNMLTPTMYYVVEFRDQEIPNTGERCQVVPLQAGSTRLICGHCLSAMCC